MPLIEGEVMIDAPAERVFDFLADPENVFRPRQSPVDLQRTGDGRWTARYRAPGAGGRTYECVARLVTADRPNRLRIEIRTPGQNGDTEIEISERDGTARVHRKGRIRQTAIPFGPIVARLSVPAYKEAGDRNADCLKQELESGTWTGEAPGVVLFRRLVRTTRTVYLTWVLAGLFVGALLDRVGPGLILRPLVGLTVLLAFVGVGLSLAYRVRARREGVVSLSLYRIVELAGFGYLAFQLCCVAAATAGSLSALRGEVAFGGVFLVVYGWLLAALVAARFLLIYRNLLHGTMAAAGAPGSPSESTT